MTGGGAQIVASPIGDAADLAHEPALLRRVYDFWAAARPIDGALPRRKVIDPTALRDLLPNLILLEVVRDPLDFRFRLLGEELLARSAANYSGRLASDTPIGRDGAIWRSFALTAERATPFLLHPPYVGASALVRSVSQLTLPFASSGNATTHILAAIAFEETED